MKFIKMDDEAKIPDSAELVFEECISPNEAYVTNNEDYVYYKIRVYQAVDNQIIVSAESNSVFFETVQYEVDCNHIISKDDIQVKWMTLSGGSEPTESDQYGLAYVSISENGTIFNEKVISFVSKGIKAITDVIG